VDPSIELELLADPEFQRRLEENRVEIRRIFRKWTWIQCSSMCLITCIAVAIGRWA
jgi:hypothetical protein